MKQKLLLKTMLLLCALIVGGVSSAWATDYSTIYTSNCTLAAGTNGSTCKVQIDDTEYNGIKVGSNKSGGDMTVTVPAGAKYLYVHVAAWKGVTGLSLNITPNTNISPTSIGLTADDGISNSSPFTFSGTASSSDFYKTITFKNALTEETTFTFTTSTTKRFVIWGVNYEAAATTHTLTYSATNGSIAGVDAGSNVVASGDEVAEGATVTLTATPADGFEFSSWSDGGDNSTLSSTTTNPTTFTMGTANATVTANFVAAATVTALAVKTAPTKLNYKVGETLDLTGLVLDATVGGNHVDVTTGYTASPANGATLNSVRALTVTFTYGGQTTTQKIHVGELTGIAITTAPTKTTYYEGQTFDPTGMVVTATFSDLDESPTEWTEDVTAACTFDPDTDTALETSDTEITVTYVWGSNHYDTYQDITVTTIPTHTAQFSVNGTIDNNNNCTVAEGAAITFPANPFDIYGKTFVGWTTATISGTTNTAPTPLVTSATMGNSNITYYAVFADVTPGTETSTTKTITTSTTNIPTSYGTANTFSECTLEGIKFMVQQMYLNNSKLQWRASDHSSGAGTMYNKDALNKIQSVVLTYNGDSNKNFTLKIGDSENPTSGTPITPSVSQQDENEYTYDCSSYNKSYFVLTNGTGAGYLASIAITYLAGTLDTYSNYSTSVVPTHTLTYSATNGSIAGEDGNSAAVVSGASVCEGATVTLTATPDEDYEFVSWSVEGTGSTLSSTTANPTTFTMGTANATVTATFNYTRVANTINAIADKEVGVLKSITLTPTSSNGTTPFTFSTTSDKISLSTESGTSCTVTGLDVTGETDAVVVIGQAAGTHNDVKYLAAENINVNISVVDNRTTPSITFSSDVINLTTGNDQTVTVTTDHTGTRSVTSSDDDIASVEMNSGNVYVLAGDKGGTATITLSIAENGDYKATSKTFTVNVDDGLSDPTITISSNEIGINAVKEFTLTSNSEGAITISTDNDHAVLEDNGDGTFNLTSDTEGTVVVNVSQAANGSYRAYETTFDISVVDNRATPTFSFSDASMTVEWDNRGDYVKPTLTNTSDATVAYTSSNTGVATVDSNGDITFVAGGTTTITANVSGSANYKDAQASYTLTVNKPFEFVDDFAGATISSGALSTTAHSSGWTTSSAEVNNSEGVSGSSCIKLASGKSGGSITTPALTELPTYSKMTFQAKSFGTDTSVSLSVSGTNCTITSPSPASFDITSSYATYTVYITKTGNNPTITISAPTAGKRAYIDNVSITDLPNATISISNVELRAGETANASITTNNETGAFTFVSSDETVATVAKVGDNYVVTGVAEGTATITATQAGNTYYKTTSTTFTVNVISATAVMNPTLSEDNGATVEVGNTITINAEEGCTIKYTTDNTDPTVSGTATSVETNTAIVTIPTGVNSLTLKAVAKNGENFSEVVTATYTVVKKTLNASFASDAIVVAIGGDAAEPALTNPSGGTVTWTSSDTEVVTVDSEGQLTAIAKGTATITASIAATDTYLAGTATYVVTVYDPTNIVVDFNNDVFGIGNAYEQNASLSYSYMGISFDFAKGEGSTNPRVDGNVSDKVARLYTDNILTVTAPTGYAISEIVFDFNKGSVTIGEDSYSTTDGTTWQGLQTPVQITGSTTAFINKMTISLTEAETFTVTASGYLSYCSPYKLDFSETVVKAYKASVNNTNGTVTLTQVDVVPAGEGVVLFSSEAKTAGEEKTYSIPVTAEEASDVTGNQMVGVLERTRVLWNPSDGVYNYILQQGQFNKAYSGDDVNVGFLKANRAYLSTDFNVSAHPQARMIIVFNNETTGISSMQDAEWLMNNAVYDLQGRRVETPRKGSLYIVNGKKVVY